MDEFYTLSTKFNLVEGSRLCIQRNGQSVPVEVIKAVNWKRSTSDRNIILTYWRCKRISEEQWEKTKQSDGYMKMQRSQSYFPIKIKLKLNNHARNIL